MKVRYLEPKELKRGNRITKIDLTPYKEKLKAVPEGGGMDVSLEEGESSRTTKRRFTSAAKDLGKEIVYRSTKEGSFRIVVK